MSDFLINYIVSRNIFKKFAVLPAVVLLVLLLLCCRPAAVAAAEAAPAQIMVYVDGDLISFRDQQPYIDEQGRTLVPVRFPAEHLGAVVAWDEAAQQVTLEHEQTGRTIRLWLNRADYMVNDTVKEMDTVPVMSEAPARVMVPLRFISEALDVELTWHFAEDIDTGFVFNFTGGLSDLEQLRMMDEIIREQIKALTKPPLFPTPRAPEAAPESPSEPAPGFPAFPFPDRRQEQDSTQPGQPTEPAIPVPSRPTAPTPPSVNS